MMDPIEQPHMADTTVPDVIVGTTSVFAWIIFGFYLFVLLIVVILFLVFISVVFQPEQPLGAKIYAPVFGLGLLYWWSMVLRRPLKIWLQAGILTTRGLFRKRSIKLVDLKEVKYAILLELGYGSGGLEYFNLTRHIVKLVDINGKYVYIDLSRIKQPASEQLYQALHPFVTTMNGVKRDKRAIRDFELLH